MNILVFAEHRSGAYKKASFEAVKAASTLAAAAGGTVAAVAVGSGILPSAGSVGRYGAARCIVATNPKLDQGYATASFATAVAAAAAAAKADLILLPATAMGRDLAPRLAVKLNAAVASDCTALRWEEGRLVARRPVYAGKALIDVTMTTPVQIATLRPNVFNAGAPGDADAPVEEMPVDIPDAEVAARVTETKTAGGKLDVAEANMIVSGGRGMQGPEHFHLVEEIASLLHAATGASRAVVDAGWRPHAEQVGQTGKTVSPSLYVACGISGAIQHLAGMSSSKVIVAINKDKDAPIFSVADYGIVGDVFEVLPALAAELKKYFGN